jgi:hypothetical protein
VKITKTSNWTGTITGREDDYILAADADIRNIVLAINGRIRFGSSNNGDAGENIAGEFISFTSSGTADNEDAVSHTLGSFPQGYIVVNQDTAGVLYDSGTQWSTTSINVKSSVASTTYKIFLLK